MMKSIFRPALLVVALAATPLSAQAPGKLVGLTRAIGIAERSLSARAIEGELERSGNRLVYEIDLVRGDTLHRAIVDARSGRMLSTTRPRAENWLRTWFDRARFPGGVRTPPLSEQLAALERASRGEVREVEFEMRKGRPVYEVELVTAAGIGHAYIDAATGRRLDFAFDD